LVFRVLAYSNDRASAKEGEQVSKERKEFIDRIILDREQGEPSESAQLVIRARAVVLARVSLALTGRSLRASLEREKQLLDAAVNAAEGVDTSGLRSLEYRSAARAEGPGQVVELPNAADGRTLFGYFARFNEATIINDAREGHFVERVAPGAFSKTIAERRERIYVNYDHGKDPAIGRKPLGVLTSLHEDQNGGAFEVRLSDTSFNRDIAAMARDSLLGASFAFQVTRDSWTQPRRGTPSNPDALPERIIKAVELYELGPVSVPAYPSARVGMRDRVETSGSAGPKVVEVSPDVLARRRKEREATLREYELRRRGINRKDKT
jgi:HK97 family phage prohead protease